MHASRSTLIILLTRIEGHVDQRGIEESCAKSRQRAVRWRAPTRVNTFQRIESAVFQDSADFAVLRDRWPDLSVSIGPMPCLGWLHPKLVAPALQALQRSDQCRPAECTLNVAAARCLLLAACVARCLMRAACSLLATRCTLLRVRRARPVAAPCAADCGAVDHGWARSRIGIAAPTDCKNAQDRPATRTTDFAENVNPQNDSRNNNDNIKAVWKIAWHPRPDSMRARIM